MIPNERLMECVEQGTSFFEAFRIADDILRQAVQGISDIITIPGIINRDFADVKTIMSGQGYAVMGTAVASGSNRAIDAANRAINSPLLEDNCINGAQGILINVTGSSSLSLHEIHEASSIIQKAAHENANIIFGAVQDDAMKESVKITVIAAGFREVAGQEGAHAAVVSAEDVEGRARDRPWLRSRPTWSSRSRATSPTCCRKCRRTISTCPHSSDGRHRRHSGFFQKTQRGCRDLHPC